MTFLFEEKNVSFCRYQNFCDFMKSADFKFCDIIISIAG